MKYPIQVLFREYFEGILAAVFLALFLRFFVVNILYIPSENLSPNLIRGDFVLGWRLSYGFPLPLMKGERLNLKVPKRGDLISFRFPGDEEQIIIRRVVGLPGDRISSKGGVISVNGISLVLNSLDGLKAREQAFESDYEYDIMVNTTMEIEELEVPENKIFVLSDNRLKSDDSRDWGFVPVQNVESRIALIWLSVSNSDEGISLQWPRILQSVK